MRIAIIAPPWVPVPPPAYGGTETVLDTLARGLAAAGHEVLLYTTADSTCPVRRSWVFESARGVGAAGAAAAELRHVLAAYEAVADYEVVHDHTLIGPVYANRFPWLPVVTTDHGPFVGDLGPLYRAVSDRAPVIAISHHQASRAAGVNLAGVVHHGVDLDRFAVGEGRGGYGLFLGRMHPDKGVHVAVRAARASGMPLKIAAKMSESHEISYFTERVKPLLGGDTEYIGEVGGAEKVRLLGEATCLLNPIGWPEPFGMVMVEALATGTPVVATHAGAAPEIVEHGVTGFLADDLGELSAALGKVAELDRQACRQAARQRFSAERMVAEHLAIYRDIAKGKNSAVFGPTDSALPPNWILYPANPTPAGAASLTSNSLVGSRLREAGPALPDPEEPWVSKSRSPSGALPSS